MPQAKRVRELLDRLEHDYQFMCEGGPLAGCVEWQELKAALLSADPPQEKNFIVSVEASLREALINGGPIQLCGTASLVSVR